MIKDEYGGYIKVNTKRYNVILVFLFFIVAYSLTVLYELLMFILKCLTSFFETTYSNDTSRLENKIIELEIKYDVLDTILPNEDNGKKLEEISQISYELKQIKEEIAVIEKANKISTLKKGTVELEDSVVLVNEKIKKIDSLTKMVISEEIRVDKKISSIPQKKEELTVLINKAVDTKLLKEAFITTADVIAEDKQKEDKSSNKDKKENEHTNEMKVGVVEKSKIQSFIVSPKKHSKELQDVSDDLTKINSKIKSVESYNKFYELERDIKKVKTDLEGILEDYNKYKNDPDYLKLVSKINMLSSYKFVPSDKVFNTLKEELNNSLVFLNKRKKEIFNFKVVVAPEIIKKESEKNKMLVKPVEEEEVVLEDESELKFLEEKEYVNEEIENSYIDLENEANKVSMEINNNPHKKDEKVNGWFGYMFNKPVRFALSFAPVMYFTNKIFGGILTYSIINNSIRKSRNIVNENNSINELNYKSYLNTIDVNTDRKAVIDSLLDDTSMQMEELFNDINLNRVNLNQSSVQRLVSLENEISKRKQQSNNLNMKNNKILRKIRKVV